ncbi:MEDS domain-containing protein [Halovenus sp. HT40]|uniref:MEDS domain-containing protein n=1 Tax=Halovenus sp. HT40 TaxID=3126691 RepID=UPI00300EFE7F
MIGIESLESSSQSGAAGQRTERLLAELGQADLSRHLALFYEEPATQVEMAATFICFGLQSNQRCLYLLDSNDRRNLTAALADMGIDVEKRIAAGDLEISDASSVYLESGFKPDEMIETLEIAVETSLEDGYDGLYVAGENTWCFHTETSFDHILDFEIDFDATCPEYPVTALCQYDLNRFCQESIAKALWTHEQIIYRYALCENPYYLSPEEYRSQSETRLNPKLMLEQTYDLAQSRRRLRRREQRLEVVSRVLRHNIRNDLNVVSGNIELLQEADALTAEDRARLETALQHIDDVSAIADKARYVQETLDPMRVERVSLDSLLTEVVDEVSEVLPEATVQINEHEEYLILADTNIGEAIFELLTTILRCQEGEPPTAGLSVESTSPGTVQVHVEAPDPLIPPSDRQALRRGTETQLQHGSGLGLWLVKWIIENGYGRLDLPEDETRLSFEFKRAME